MKPLRLLLVAGVLLGLSATLSAQNTASARSFTSYFFFGDSLTDMGNTFYVSGQPPAPYYNGRFSNGPTYAEYLAAGLQRSLTAPASVTTNLNFAFAGATATSAYATSSTPATLTQEVGMFAARGITPKATDLFVVWAGANDILNYLGSTATPSGAGAETAATASVTAVTSNVTTLVNAGARNVIVMTLPDISRTARFVTGSAAPAASLAQDAVYTYGSGIRTSMAALAASSGAKITVVDTTALLNTIIANATKLGFSDTTHDVVDTLTSGGSVANPNSYIFWDGIHPTTAVHALFASSLTEVLNPEFVLGSAATQGSLLALGGDLMADSLDHRLAQIRGGTTRNAADGFITYAYADGGLNAAGYRKQFDYSGSVITGGFDARLTPNLTLGLAASAETLTAKVKPAAGSFALNGHLITAFAQWKPASVLFVEASASLGSATVDKIRRVTMLGGLLTSGSAAASQRAFGARLGADLPVGGGHLTPYAGVRYFSGKIDGYTETGVGGLNFGFGEQRAEALTPLFGVDGSWAFHVGEMPVNLGLSCAYEGNSTRNKQFSGQITDTVTPTASITNDASGGQTIKAGVSFTGSFSQRWSWTVGYTGDMRKDGKTGGEYSFGLQTGF